MAARWKEFLLSTLPEPMAMACLVAAWTTVLLMVVVVVMAGAAAAWQWAPDQAEAAGVVPDEQQLDPC
jgi:hypothetical protein